jgi:hypothetical protein
MGHDARIVVPEVAGPAAPAAAAAATNIHAFFAVVSAAVRNFSA